MTDRPFATAIRRAGAGSSARTRPAARLAARHAGSLVASLAVVAAATVLRAVMCTDPDTSWLLYVAARTLAGAVPYRDILEVNPPASILLYVPPVWLAGRLGLSPEAVTDAFVFAASFAGLGLSASILLRSGCIRPGEAPRLAAPALAVLLLLPMNNFAQREHIAALALLPALACLAVRLHGPRPHFAAVVLAGLAAGVAVSIKPVFGLAFAGPLLLLLSGGSPRRVFAAGEVWIAAGLTLLYGLAVRAFVPDFADRVLPLVMAIYLPARLPLFELLTKPFFWIWLALLLSVAALRPRGERASLVPLLASAGLMAGVFIQGKGFSYHAYPAIALAALAGFRVIVRDRTGGRPRTLVAGAGLVVGVLAIVGATNMFLMHAVVDRDAPGLRAAVATISTHPRTLTIGPTMPFGRVLARQMGGEWVGSMPLAWITLFASLVAADPERDPRFAAAITMERNVYARDIEREQPDIVLVEGESWLRWARRGSALAEALAPYAEAGRYGDLILFRRAASPGPSAQATPPASLPTGPMP